MVWAHATLVGRHWAARALARRAPEGSRKCKQTCFFFPSKIIIESFVGRTLVESEGAGRMTVRKLDIVPVGSFQKIESSVPLCMSTAAWENSALA